MKKIAITGASGFLGTELVKKLKKDKNLVLKIPDPSDMEFLFDLNKLKSFVEGCDIVYHLAGIKDSNDSNLFKVNVNGTKNLLEAVRLASPKSHFIFSSSFAVYKIPEISEVVDEKFPLNPRNKYGSTKLLAEEVIKSYSDLYKIKSTILRISNIYGVIYDFIHKIKNGEKIKIEGDGNQTRDFVFITDVVKAFVLADKSKQKFGIYNISSGEETSIKDMVSLIEKIINKKAKISFVPENNQGGYWKGDYSLARKIFGWKPEITLIKGISKIVKI